MALEDAVSRRKREARWAVHDLLLAEGVEFGTQEYTDKFRAILQDHKLIEDRFTGEATGTGRPRDFRDDFFDRAIREVIAAEGRKTHAQILREWRLKDDPAWIEAKTRYQSERSRHQDAVTDDDDSVPQTRDQARSRLSKLTAMAMHERGGTHASNFEAVKAQHPDLVRLAGRSLAEE